MLLRRILMTQILIATLSIPVLGQAQAVGDYSRYEKHPHQLLFFSKEGAQLSIKAYNAHTVRVQVARKGETFLPDAHYEMVEVHTMRGEMTVAEAKEQFTVTTGGTVKIIVHKQPLRVDFIDKQGMLLQGEGVEWNNSIIKATFKNDTSEHFCGLGHQAFGLVPSIDLKGQTARSNYGNYDYNVDDDPWLAQAFLVVPFYISGKGYGVFVNSTFPNQFSFGKNGDYSLKLDTKGFKGQLDYFFIAGPSFRDVLDKYTQLTGRPRLPQLSIFGLHLSDKDTPENEGAVWWMNKIKEHRAAGLPLDHIVNDNRWRAGTGAWSGSWFEWDKQRYPDPAAYKKWTDSNGLTMTLDHNRNNGSLSWGWKPSFNIPHSGCVKESYAVPDYSDTAVRNWIWRLFWTKSFNPALKYPGDGIWMDEIDELQCIPDTVITGNRRSWAENRNYYPFLVAKAVVQEGWDNKNNNEPSGIGEAKRPYMWGRGSTAGGQRYATHWTGDLRCSYDWMRKTIRGMQASGLSGFPYFNHDAGGFREPGPDDNMYIQWAMAFGSFTPIWRPHGVSGSPRWPLGRSVACQQAAKVYSRIRYELMPYIYTNAYNASAHGVPMARAMVVDYGQWSQAWKYDLQYMWGDNMLVAPQTTGRDSAYAIWLPPSKWYYLWNDSVYQGAQVITHLGVVGELPVFVKAGAIIPKYDYALSTVWMNKKKVTLEVYAGADGSFTLYEDDGVTERYKTRSEHTFTTISYKDKEGHIIINPAEGSYKGAPAERQYRVVMHHVMHPKKVNINGRKCDDVVYDNSKKQLIFTTGLQSVHNKISISLNE